MKLYNEKCECGGRPVVLDDMILTKAMPTTAGSKMLGGFMSLFDAEAVTRLQEAGFSVCGKAAVGEFGFDLLGESSVDGALTRDGKLVNACCEIVSSGEALAAVSLDVNGATRRAAAQSGLVSVKPTYGTVSRYGTIPVACSGECVSVTAKTAAACLEVLSAVSGYDSKDGTSLSDEKCKAALVGGEIKRAALVKELYLLADGEVKGKVDALINSLRSSGVEICEISIPEITCARAAWNILMTAELCNNVSRYDGVKYGYRAESFLGLDELYTKSRTEAFGKLLKTAIIYGSEALSTENYMKVYDKALRTRRVIVDALNKVFAEYGAIITPACSSMSYAADGTALDECFAENIFTAPASISGMPAVVTSGAMLMGAAFSEGKLLELAEKLEKEGK